MNTIKQTNEQEE